MRYRVQKYTRLSRREQTLRVRFSVANNGEAEQTVAVCETIRATSCYPNTNRSRSYYYTRYPRRNETLLFLKFFCRDANDRTAPSAIDFWTAIESRRGDGPRSRPLFNRIRRKSNYSRARYPSARIVVSFEKYLEREFSPRRNRECYFTKFRNIHRVISWRFTGIQTIRNWLRSGKISISLNPVFDTVQLRVLFLWVPIGGGAPRGGGVLAAVSDSRVKSRIQATLNRIRSSCAGQSDVHRPNQKIENERKRKREGERLDR